MGNEESLENHQSEMSSFEASTTSDSTAEAPSVATNICCSTGCGKAAEMACPTCLKLGLPPSRFCSQQCFKDNWNEHKGLHKLIKQARADVKVDPSTMPTEFRGYHFTGSLRPFQKTPKRTVPPQIARPDYADHPTVCSLKYVIFENLFLLNQ